jgi:hypothetical protein
VVFPFGLVSGMERTADPSAPLRMTRGRVALPSGIG